jgi:DNA-binding CsgD family transcriptional regulator
MTDVREATWRFINRAPIVGRQQALDALLAETLDSFGVDRFDCVRLTSAVEYPLIMSDQGLQDWNRYFVRQRYHETDPCLQTGMQLQRPYTWTDVRTMAGQSDSAMWADARAGGMRECLIVPTTPRRPSGALVRLVTPEPRFNPADLPLLQSISVIYAFSTQTIFGDGAPSTHGVPPPAGLTERELECLHWSARGKTNREIAIILDISHHTVNTHIESAKRKLGVGTRVQAAAIAHRLGLLSIA